MYYSISSEFKYHSINLCYIFFNDIWQDVGVHAPYKQPYRYCTSCCGIKLFRTSRQNMRECLRAGSRSIHSISNASVFFFLHFSSPFFSKLSLAAGSGPKYSMTQVWRCYGIVLCIRCLIHSISILCKRMQTSDSSFLYFVALSEPRLPPFIIFIDWNISFRSDLHTSHSNRECLKR